jgi:hypothetical protein
MITQSEVRPGGEREVEDKGCVHALRCYRSYAEGTLDEVAERREDDEQNDNIDHVSPRTPEQNGSHA